MLGNLAAAVNIQIIGSFQAPPYRQDDTVSRAYYIIISHRNIGLGSEAFRTKEGVTELGKPTGSKPGASIFGQQDFTLNSFLLKMIMR